MSRYFTMRHKPSGWVEDEDAWPVSVAGHILTVDEHIAIDTGLLDANGNCIMRAPNPIGFGKDDEW